MPNRRLTLRRFQQRWRYRRIRRGMYLAGRRYRMTPVRHRIRRHFPNWYFRYGRYRRLRY